MYNNNIHNYITKLNHLYSKFKAKLDKSHQLEQIIPKNYYIDFLHGRYLKNKREIHTEIQLLNIYKQIANVYLRTSQNDKDIKGYLTNVYKQLSSMYKQDTKNIIRTQLKFGYHCMAFAYLGYLIEQKFIKVRGYQQETDGLLFCNLGIDSPTRIHNVINKALSKYQIKIIPKNKTNQHTSQAQGTNHSVPTLITKYQNGVHNINKHKQLPIGSKYLKGIHKYYNSNNTFKQVAREFNLTQNKYTKQGHQNIKAHPSLHINAGTIDVSIIYQLICNPLIMRLYNQHYGTNHKVGELRDANKSFKELPIKNSLTNILHAIYTYYNSDFALTTTANSSHYNIREDRYVLDGINYIKNHKDTLHNIPKYHTKADGYMYDLLCSPRVMRLYNQHYGTHHPLGDIRKNHQNQCQLQLPLNKNLRHDYCVIHKYYTGYKALTTIEQEYKVDRDLYVTDGLKYFRHNKQLRNNAPRNTKGKIVKHLNTYYLLCSPKFMRLYNLHYGTNHKLGELRSQSQQRQIDGDSPF